MSDALYIGLMSGTSVDAVDSAIVSCNAGGINLLAAREHPIPPALKTQIAAISHPGDNEIDRMGALDRLLGELFADAVRALLEETGHPASAITAIGSHGQTIRHRPPSAQPATPPDVTVNRSFTLQIGDPSTIAQRTGITTVADFRRRDMCLNGEGAPLAPAFHAACFASPGLGRAIINIGGISNVTLLHRDGSVQGFDTGPGNTLLDHWITEHRGLPFDRDGAWAAEGEVDQALLEALLSHTFLHQSGPRSTGKEAFNMSWLKQQLASLPQAPEPQQVQATLAEFTAECITRGIQACGAEVDEIYVCGGGAHNTDLMRRLYQQLQPATLDSTAALGLDPDWVEAVAFAWLAYRTLAGLPGNLPAVTGAAEAVVLGGIYPGAGGLQPA